MRSVADALDEVVKTVSPLPVIKVPLVEALGLTLGEDVDSPADSPPFDKSLMDGYAVRSADIQSNQSLSVVETITAGRVPTKRLGPGEAAQIMTGAPLPEGCDAVVKVEETQRDADRVIMLGGPVTAGANLIRRGTVLRAGDRVLREGMLLNGACIGALAELGWSTVSVRRRPRVAVLATGDELVPIERTPGPGQIRNSNAAMLVAQIQSAGGIAVQLGIARDSVAELRSKIEQGLQFDLLILSGGVSAGTLDLVPSTLASAGVREVFHKVEMKPGKPIWFGQLNRTLRTDTDPDKLGDSAYVFGLPGNPVSSLVCCEIFVRTALRRLMGAEPAMPQPIWAKLEHAYSTRTDRPTYHPARLTWLDEGLTARLIPWHGSSDLCSTVAANGMVFLSGEAHQYQIGDTLPSFAW